MSDTIKAYSPSQATMLSLISQDVLSMARGAIGTCVTLCAAEVILPGMVTSSGRNMTEERRKVYAEYLAATSVTDTKRQFQRAAAMWTKWSDSIQGAVNTRLDGTNNESVIDRTVTGWERQAISAAIQAIVDKLAGESIKNQYQLDVWLGLAKPPKGAPSDIEKAKAAAEKAAEKVRTLEQDAERAAAAELAEKQADSAESRTLAILEAVKVLALRGATVAQWGDILESVMRCKLAAEERDAANAGDMPEEATGTNG